LPAFIVIQFLEKLGDMDFFLLNKLLKQNLIINRPVAHEESGDDLGMSEQLMFMNRCFACISVFILMQQHASRMTSTAC
jgi:hypothetical protein